MTKGEATRQKIIVAAAPIFNQRGFAGCSMQDVLDATGVEKGCVYRHFSSKEELATAAFKYSLAEVVKVRTEGMKEISNSVEKLRYFVERFVKIASPIQGGCPLMNTAIDADDGNPELRELARKGIEAWKARIEKIVKAGMKRGEVRENVRPCQIANSVIALLEGSLMISRVEGTRRAMKDAQETLGRLLDEIAVTPMVRQKNN